jgi:hypothetical protein
MRAKNYDLTSTAWGALVFPNPETSFGGHLADIEDNNNVTSLKNARVDELCKAYDAEYDVKKRIELVREIDRLGRVPHGGLRRPSLCVVGGPGQGEGAGARPRRRQRHHGRRPAREPLLAAGPLSPQDLLPWRPTSRGASCC